MTSSHRILGVLCLSSFLAPGCGLTLDYEPPDDATGSDAGDGGPRLDAPPPPVDAPAPDAGGLDANASPDATDGGGSDAPFDVPPDIGPVECVSDGDCDGLYGPAPCGAWSCSANSCRVICAGCTDGDFDGYGVGTGCAGLDCDDADDTVGPTASRGCYPGSPSTSGVGVCVSGTEDCTAGVWGACLGAVLPGAESCNGLDDDCDGLADDGLGTTACGLGACATTAPLCVAGALAACVAPVPLTTIDGCNGLDDDCDGRTDESCTNCVWVGTGAGASDTSPDPRVVSTPFRTIQVAIDWAAADATRPQRVCLLSNGCSNAMAIFSGAVTMADGVSVSGSWAPTGASVCPIIRTEIRTGTGTGVYFPDAVASPTSLTDVAITPHTTSDVAGVTIEGGTGIVLRNVTVNTTTAGVTTGHGVVIVGGGDALITRSSISAGRGSSEAVGVRVDGGRVTLLDDCPVALDSSGRCPSGCPWMTASSGIRGRSDATPSRGAVSYAVLLRNAPGSTISGIATCGHTSSRGAGIRIEGDATGVVVRGSYVAGWGGEMESYGVDMVDCAGASPWIVDNAEINAEGPMTAPIAAVRSLGDCHPVIERNVRIVSGLEGQGMTTGVHCGPRGSISSRCVIERNPSIRSTAGGFPVTSTGVRCEADACARIFLNDISAFQGQTIVGLSLGTTDALVSRNRISAGCAAMSAVGVISVGSRARLENNILLGGLPCSAGSASTATRFVAVVSSSAGSRGLLDLRSNTLDPGGVIGGTLACTSHGIEIEGAAGVPPLAIRGNVVLAGTCRAAYPVYELGPGGDPAALECNDLVPATGGPVYRDEGSIDLASAPLVNALTDTVTGGNLDTPAGFVAYPANLDLAAGSACIDADTAAGAPAVDYDGHARIGVPDIGAYEN